MRVSRRRALLTLAAGVAVLAGCAETRPDITPTESYGNPTATARPTNTPRPTPPPATPGGAGGGMEMPPPMGDNVVAYTGKDFLFESDKSSVRAGMVVLYLRNAGPSPHNIHVKGNGVDKESKTINANQSDQFSIELRPGTYDVICTIAGHEQLGMKVQLTVM